MAPSTESTTQWAPDVPAAAHNKGPSIRAEESDPGRAAGGLKTPSVGAGDLRERGKGGRDGAVEEVMIYDRGKSQ